MENESSRYRDNNYRMQKLQREMQYRKRKRRILILSGLCTCFLVAAGILVYLVLFSGKQESGQKNPEHVTEASEKAKAIDSGISDDSMISRDALQEAIAKAEKTADAAVSSMALDLLNQRIKEAKEVLEGRSVENSAGVAYLNLILAMQELE